MWKTVKLGDVCTIKTGRKDVNEGNALGQYPFFTCAKEHTFSDGYSFDCEAILIAGNGAVGQTTYFKGKFEAYQRTYVLSEFEGIESKLLLFILQGKLMGHLSSMVLGNTIPYIKKGMLQDFEFSLPPLAEQQRIVAKLDAAFAEIDRIVESYEDSISNAKDCLSQVRASRISEMLNSSQKAKLGSLASLKNGLNYNKSEKGYPVKILGVGDFGNRFKTGTEGLQMIETSSPVSTDYHLEHGDIVFVRSNGNKQLIGRSIIIENPNEPSTFSGFCIRCRIEVEDISSLFLCHYLKSSVVRDKLISGGIGTNISSLNQKMLADIDVPLLSEHEQMSLVRWIEGLEKSFEDLLMTLVKRVQLADKLKSTILAQELQPPQSEAA